MAIEDVQIAAIIDNAPELPLAVGATSDEENHKKRISQRDALVAVAKDYELWHDANSSAYAAFQVGTHRENWPIRSRRFRLWLSKEYFGAKSTAIGGTALDDGLRLLEARAINTGPNDSPFLRIGRHADKLYLDLADGEWRAVEINADGWSVIRDPPVRFLRTAAMRPLPEPERGGMIEEFRRFVNVRTDDDFRVTVAWLVSALRDSGPYPILAVNGEQGSGKSNFCLLLRSLIDPSAAPIRAAPKDEHNILISASNSWILAFDNLSSIPTWLSDALCRLATGSGFATRANYTDRDEIIFEAARPILLNGIPMLTERADLADRTLTVQLKTIEATQRRTEKEIFSDFEASKARILAALLDGTSAALRNAASVRLPRLPRLADFAVWATAAEAGLGWAPGSFLPTYDANRRDVSDAAFEADLVAVVISKFVTTAGFPDGWRGSATELLTELNAQATESTRKSRRWPGGASALGNAVTRASPLLRAKGFSIERRHSGGREIEIIPPPGLKEALP